MIVTVQCRTCYMRSRHVQGAAGEQRKQCVHNGLVASSGNGVAWEMTGAKCGKLMTKLKFHVEQFGLHLQYNEEPLHDF